MGSVSSEGSSGSSSDDFPIHCARTGTKHLSVSAVSPIRGMAPYTPSLESPSDPTLPHGSRKQAIQLVFPYAPAIISEVSFLSPSLGPVVGEPCVLRRLAQPYSVASEAEPLKSIPTCLIPNDHMRYLPPILHFGWAIDEDKLLEWCVTEGFHRTTTDINGHDVFDYTGTVSGALHYFAQRSGAGMFSPYIQLTCHRREPIIAALASNYLMPDGLSGRKTEILALGSLLKREGLLKRDSVAARWHLDFKDWRWIANKTK